MGMFNYDTILSAYDDKLTLMQWLKKVEKALDEAAATSFIVNKKGNATISFSIVFEDGSEIESGDIVLQQGESVAAGRIENGHLILTLTNGDELDAGNLFNGNVNIVGDVSITGNLSAENITGNSIIENMSGYIAVSNTAPGYLKENIYLGVVKTGNKITFVVSMDITKQEGAISTLSLAYFNIPISVGVKLIPSGVGSATILDNRKLNCFSALQNAVEVNGYVSKGSNTQITFACIGSPMVAGTTYHVRYEATFLLSDNLAA